MSQKKARARRRANRERETHERFAGENAAIVTLAGITLLSRAREIDGFIAPGKRENAPRDFPALDLVCISLLDAGDVAELLIAIAIDSRDAAIARACFSAAEQLRDAILSFIDCEAPENARIGVTLPRHDDVAELLAAISRGARNAEIARECFAASNQLAGNAAGAMSEMRA